MRPSTANSASFKELHIRTSSVLVQPKKEIISSFSKMSKREEKEKGKEKNDNNKKNKKKKDLDLFWN